MGSPGYVSTLNLGLSRLNAWTSFPRWSDTALDNITYFPIGHKSCPQRQIWRKREIAHGL
jgi:hypothetical protein